MRDDPTAHSTTELNFWPAFADLMLAVVFVLTLIIFIVAATLMAGQIDLSHVEANQRLVVEELARSFGSRIDSSATAGRYEIPLGGGSGNTSIVVEDELALQQITFSDRVLFAPDRYEINAEGRRVLSSVGEVLKAHLGTIREIQIQGHADTVPTRRHGTNVKLAALRAIEVFTFLKDEVGIDPASHLMSVTSFGEYRPIARDEAAGSFSAERLAEANRAPNQRSANRRIELLIFYDLREGGSPRGRRY